jgi:hypothetical protein
MWVPSKAEAVEIFARHFEARHRSGALQKAEETARHLKSTGDVAGHDIWCEVAASIERIRNTGDIPARRGFEQL